MRENVCRLISTKIFKIKDKKVKKKNLMSKEIRENNT